MPTFDYRGAKAAGYSDAEIMQHLEAEHAAGRDWSLAAGDTARAQQPAAPRGPSPMTQAPLIPTMPTGPTIGQGAGMLPLVGGFVGARAGAMGAGAGTALGEFARQRIMGEPANMGSAAAGGVVAGLTAGAGSAIGKGVGAFAKNPALRKVVGNIAARRTGLRGVAKDARAVRDAVKPPVAAAPKLVPKAKAAPKPKASPAPKPAAAAPAPPTTPIKVAGKPKAARITKQRGVSGRALETRKKALAKVAERKAAAVTPNDPATRLEMSLAFEKEMAKRGFSQQQKQALRRGAMEYLQGGAQ